MVYQDIFFDWTEFQTFHIHHLVLGRHLGIRSRSRKVTRRCWEQSTASFGRYAIIAIFFDQHGQSSRRCVECGSDGPTWLEVLGNELKRMAHAAQNL